MKYNPPTLMHTSFIHDNQKFEEKVYFVIDSVEQDENSRIVKVHIHIILGIFKYLKKQEYNLVPDSYEKNEIPRQVMIAAENYLKYN